MLAQARVLLRLVGPACCGCLFGAALALSLGGVGHASGAGAPKALAQGREALFVANCVPEWPASFERGPEQLSG